MHVLRDDRVKKSKAAVVVSRKVHKSAVKRNLIRRRIYEIVRDLIPEFKSPSEIVITVYQAEVADLPHKELQRAIKNLFSRAGL